MHFGIYNARISARASMEFPDQDPCLNMFLCCQGPISMAIDRNSTERIWTVEGQRRDGEDVLNSCADCTSEDAAHSSGLSFHSNLILRP